MSLVLTEEQELLRDAARDFVNDQCAIDGLRQLRELGASLSGALADAERAIARGQVSAPPPAVELPVAGPSRAGSEPEPPVGALAGAEAPPRAP